jgi:hypothetical protein
VSLDERPRGSTRPTPKVPYNSLPRTSIEGALDEHGFERAPPFGRSERWVRREGEQQQRYTRSEAVKRARKEGP